MAVAEADGAYVTGKNIRQLAKPDLEKMIAGLEQEMRKAARELAFERAAEARDLIIELRKEIIARGRLSRRGEPSGTPETAPDAELPGEGGRKSESWQSSHQGGRKKKSASRPGTKSSSGGRGSII